MNQIRANKDKQIADMRQVRTSNIKNSFDLKFIQAIQDAASTKKKLINEFEETKRNTAGLKMALENARNKLSDAIEVDLKAIERLLKKLIQVEDPGMTPPQTPLKTPMAPKTPATPSGPKFDESMFQPTDLSK